MGATKTVLKNMKKNGVTDGARTRDNLSRSQGFYPCIINHLQEIFLKYSEFYPAEIQQLASFVPAVLGRLHAVSRGRRCPMHCVPPERESLMLNGARA